MLLFATLKVIVYENFKLGLVQVLLSCLALVFWLWFVVWEMVCLVSHSSIVGDTRHSVSNPNSWLRTLYYAGSTFQILEQVSFNPFSLTFFVSCIFFPWRVLQNYVEVAQPFGAVTFSTGAASYAVDTASYDYCSTSSVDGCTVLQPSEALMGRGTSPGNLFVNTKVDLSYETCAAASCSASTAIGWVAPYASVAATKDMYTATKTASYLVAGVEDYSVTINHAASSPWGDKQRSADGRAGSSWGMTGVLLGPNGWSAEPLMKCVHARMRQCLRACIRCFFVWLCSCCGVTVGYCVLCLCFGCGVRGLLLFSSRWLHSNS